ncbi:MAG: hypothetical protein ACRD2G_06105 [Terriglobia bacterium]
MDNLYDIFRKTPDGSKAWLAAVDSLREAKNYLRGLGLTDASEYYVCDLSARKVVAVMRRDLLGFTIVPDLPSSEESVFFETAGAA